MSHARTGRFKVETSWQELVNRRIQKIEIDLKEITLFNRAGFLLAKGAFRREIFYVEFDGRFRRVEDRVQFEVVAGKELPEPFPMLKTELKQDYYIFQPRQVGETQAVLEQGFSLVVEEVEVDPAPEQIETIVADCILERGNLERLAQIRLGIPDKSISYQSFHGTVQFEPVSRNVISGRIQGILEYFNADHHLKSWVVDQPVSWLWEMPAEDDGTQCVLNGTIGSNPTLYEIDGNWHLDLKIDYNWVRLEKRALTCVIASATEINLPDHGYKIKAEVLLGEQELSFPKSYDLAIEGMTPVEVNITVLERNDHFRKMGLLLEALLRIEAYGRSTEGVEIYRQWEVGYSELVEGYDGYEKNEGLRIDAALRLQDVRFETTAYGLRVNLMLHYQLKIYQPQIIDAVRDEKNGVMVIVPVRTDLKSFSVMKEANLHLRRKPLQIDRIQAAILHLTALSKQGWFQITGELELTISYHHLSGKSHQEIRNVPIQESFLGEQSETDWEIQLEPAIEYDTYHLEGMNVLYKFLLHIEAGFYRKSELRLKTLPGGVFQDQFHDTAKSPDLKNFEMDEELQLIVEQEIPLQFGNPREIAQKKSYISKFEYRDALNAILTEGVFETNLEYWDENGFLRHERLDMAFWKFVPCPLREIRELSGLRLFPEIVRTSAVPVNAWPWQKGTVKISVELVLKRSKGELPP